MEYGEHLFQLLFEALHALPDFILLFFRPAIELFGRHDLSIAQRRKRESHGRPQDRDAFGRRLLVKRRKCFRVF